jgi:DNA-directed RNA polymerase I subunit RPA49
MVVRIRLWMPEARRRRNFFMLDFKFLNLYQINHPTSHPHISSKMSSGHKRKRQSEADPGPAKKPTSNGVGTSSNDSIRLSHIGKEDELPPVLAIPFGVNASLDIPLTPYVEASKNLNLGDRRLLLQSSQHPRMDYLASEDFGTGSESLLEHYLAIYDPETKELQLCKARQVALRSTLRPTVEELREREEQKQAYISRSARRQALGLEFGNKKSKKAIASMQENAIMGGGVDSEGKLNAQSKILLSAATKEMKDMPSLEEMEAASQAQKPRPKANLSATKSQDVYPLNMLIPMETMDEIRVHDWMAKAATMGLNIQSRFVARRLAAACQNKDVQKVKTMKYMLAAIQFYRASKPGRNSRRGPQRKKLIEMCPDIDPGLLDDIRKRFCKIS